MDQYIWYASLVKPSWAPPSWLFGPVWSVLYLIIFLSFGKILFLAYQKNIPLAVAFPFVLNLVFNLLFTPLQFSLRNNYLAGLDIGLVLFTLIWGITKIHPYFPTLAYLQIPYLLWVCFATILQTFIIFLNP